MGQKIHKLSLCVCVIAITLNLVECEVDDPVVTVAEGQLRGTVEPMLDGSSYYSFKGIRYASPPTRFGAPEPPKPWDGVYDATEHGPTCTQYKGILLVGEEDCLYLNVYTKSLDQGANIPVMVYIHGGAFTMGSGNSDEFGPDWLLQHDVILVTINYRLGVFGFLSFEIPEAPGNMGFRDQVAALKWVHENIVQFGGDPNQVTIFGESAGSASVAFQIHSSLSKVYFQKAIAQSGVSISDWALDREPSEKPFMIAKALGNFSNDRKELLAFLRNMPTQTVVEAAKISGYAPIVEQKFEGVEPFLSEDPTDAVLAGHVNDIPLMVGYTSDEALPMASTPVLTLSVFTAIPKTIIPRQISEKLSEERKEEFGNRLKDFFVNKKDPNIEDSEVLSKLMSDLSFIIDIHRFAYFYSKLSKTYLYRFSCATELNFAKRSFHITNKPGAAHTDDLSYLFKNDRNMDVYQKDTKLHDLVYRITKLWTNFAKTGDPTPDDSLGVKWPEYDASNLASLDINEKEFIAGENIDKSRMDFWNQMFCDVGMPCRA